MGRLEGKVALVVGAGSRFGTAVSALAREGATIAAGCGDEASGCAAVATIEGEGGKAQHVILDPTDATSCAEAVEAALAAFGRIDVLVTRVVNPPREPTSFGQLTDTDWDDAWKHVLRAAVLPIRAALPALTESGGRIVVVNSAAAGHAAFGAATVALGSLTRALAEEMNGRPRVETVVAQPGASPESIVAEIVRLASAP